MNRPRLLLVAEAATFAHVARISVLRKALSDEFDVQAAFDGRFDRVLDVEDTEHLPLFTVPSSKFMDAVNHSRFPYSEEDLTRYVTEDLRAIESARPDAVIGDFRLSLAISCRLARIPYLSLVNGYWTPACREPSIAPKIGLLGRVPRAVSGPIFELVRPLGFRFAARSFNRVATAFGVRSAHGDLLDVYAQGDRTLVAEPEGWLRMARGSSSKLVPIGAIGWTSRHPLPDWWGQWDPTCRVVYVNVGSSGDKSQIDRVCEVLGAHARVVVVVAGRSEPPKRVGRAMVWFGPFLNSRRVLEKSWLFVSNGGSLSMVDALRVGCPVVGIASNYDQVLNMGTVERHGVGTLVFDDARTRELERACSLWLERTEAQEAALKRARGAFSRGLARELLVDTVRSTLLPS